MIDIQTIQELSPADLLATIIALQDMERARLDTSFLMSQD